MAFVREVKHLRRHAQPLQRSEQLEPFRDIESIVALSVNYERRCLEACRREVRRPLPRQLAVRVWRAIELPLVEPELFRRAPGRLVVKHTIVRDETLEAVGVAEDPVDHVSAVACTERALAILVDEWIMLLGIVEALHQILKRSATPVAVNCVDELLPVAG